MRQANSFGPAMVLHGDAGAFISGLTYNYPDVLRPALQSWAPRPSEAFSVAST